MKRLAIITTHPIQYYAPLFRILHERNKIHVKVFYTWGETVLKDKYDPGFGKVINWDIPLLEGYPYEFLKNESTRPGSDHYKGIINPEIINRIDEHKPDAVLVIGWNFASHLKVMRHYKGKLPVYFRGDSTLLDEKPGFHIKKIMRRIALKQVYRHVDLAFYAGNANKAYFLKHGLKENQLRFAPHAIDNDRFSNAIADMNKRKELKINENDIVFLFAGKLEEKKDPLLLIHSFADADLPNAHLVIVGSGELENQLKAVAGERSAALAKNNKRIHFLPFQNQAAMPAVYKMADVFVLPSKGPGETWGLSVNEAMASGLAIIVSDKCGCAADLVDDNNGVVFKAGDGPALSRAMEQMANVSGLQASKESSIKKIKEYNFPHIAAAMEDAVLQ